MNNFTKFLASATLAIAAMSSAHAATSIIADNAWHEFDVDSYVSQSGGTEWIDYIDGSALTFTFTLANAAYLRVVDAGFAGDSFDFVLNGSNYSSSAVPQTEYNNNPANAGTNFDAAWADSANFSSRQVLLSAGTYTLTGMLNQSMTLDGSPLNATVGAVQIAAVPEADTYAMLLAGLGLMGLLARRRAA